MTLSQIFPSFDAKLRAIIHQYRCHSIPAPPCYQKTQNCFQQVTREKKRRKVLVVERNAVGLRVAKWAVTGYYNVPLMRTSWTPMFSLSIDGGAEKVSSRVHAGRIDIVVLRIFAHFVWVEGFCGVWTAQVSKAQNLKHDVVWHTVKELEVRGDLELSFGEAQYGMRVEEKSCMDSGLLLQCRMPSLHRYIS